ncbi:MAG: hypothetical protein WAZ77_03300 [Candidatus Nitrosopolaris sp.]
MGIVHDGEQAVGELLTGMFKGFPDFTVEIIKTILMNYQYYRL